MTDHDKTMSMEDRRHALVNTLKSQGIALSSPLETAFLSVPRHLFVPGVYVDAVYRDEAIVIKRDKHGARVSCSNKPSETATMLAAADLQPGQNVLEIGTGTGYTAALIAALVGPSGRVTTLEIDPEIAEAARAHIDRAGITTVQVIPADAVAGHPAGAPYDRIISTASVWDIPAAWIDQLAENGLLITSIGIGGIQIGAALRKQPDGSLQSIALLPLGYIPLKGEAASLTRHTRVPGSSLCVDFVEGKEIDEARIHALLSADHDLTQLPLELERQHLGLFSYYLLFFQPPAYEFITYHVEEGQLAFGLGGYGWGILSPTSACLVPFGDERVVHIYGSSDAVLTLTGLARKWEQAGRPDLRHCKLHIRPAGIRHFIPAEEHTIVRVLSRPTHNYTLWMTPPR